MWPLQRAIAAAGRIAFVFVDDFAIRPEAVVCVLAPEGPIVAMRNRRVPFGLDKHALPAQKFAPVQIDIRETGAFHG